jgi:hypothetical protein
MATENQEKFDELLTKLRTLGSRAKGIRAQVSEPVLDRILARANKNLARFGDGNGVQRPQPQQAQQPQEPTLVCPKCGVLALPGSHFCSSCGFDFEEEQRQQAKAVFEREKIERGSRVGVVF